MNWKDLLSTVRVKELYGETSTPRHQQDLRTRFQQDYDRAVFSTPVRRLQDKAQVFVMDPSDAVRTRLTHSLEVSTLARDIAGQAAIWIDEKNEQIGISGIRAIESIAATCGLIHDLGNPPFGHAGEKAISFWFKSKLKSDPKFLDFEEAYSDKAAQCKSDFLEFEGNAQTLRIISRLQMLADLRGLNFTCGTLSAACKYIAPSHRTNKDVHAMEKPGFFASEADLVHKVREATGTGEARNPITFLVEASDDIVYSMIDIEDAIRKKVVRWNDVHEELQKHADSNLLAKCVGEAQKYLDSGRLQLKGAEYDEAMGQAFRTFTMREIVPSVRREFELQYEAIMAGAYNGELVERCTNGSLVAACKKVGRTMIYPNSETLPLEIMGRNVICDLMDIFWEGASEDGGHGKPSEFPGKIFALFSKNYARVFQAAIAERLFPAKYCQLQLVTDYICGMTDSFACRLHKRLRNE